MFTCFVWLVRCARITKTVSYLLKLLKLVLISSSFWERETSSSLSLKQKWLCWGECNVEEQGRGRNSGALDVCLTTSRGESWRRQCLQTLWTRKVWENVSLAKLTQIHILDAHSHNSQNKRLVPYWVQSLLLYVCLVDFVIWHSVLYNRFTGFGSGLARSTLFLVHQYGQQTVWVTKTCSNYTRDLLKTQVIECSDM